MSVTHKEALRFATEAWLEPVSEHQSLNSKMEAAISAYLDARGLVLVPKEPTLDMQGAALRYVGRQKQTRDVYRAMLAAAPDPFAEEM